jgi:hypothetical protein
MVWGAADPGLIRQCIKDKKNDASGGPAGGQTFEKLDKQVFCKWAFAFHLKAKNSCYPRSRCFA